MIKNSFIKKILEIMSLWLLIGISVIFGRRAIEYGFTKKFFITNFKEDLIIGLGTALVVGLLMNFKKLKG